jgi:hypothetical protein
LNENSTIFCSFKNESFVFERKLTYFSFFFGK